MFKIASFYLLTFVLFLCAEACKEVGLSSKKATIFLYLRKDAKSEARKGFPTLVIARIPLASFDAHRGGSGRGGGGGGDGDSGGDGVSVGVDANDGACDGDDVGGGGSGGGGADGGDVDVVVVGGGGGDR